MLIESTCDRERRSADPYWFAYLTGVIQVTV